MKKNDDEKTVEAKHIYLDIVRYTEDRSVEAQSEIIDILNKIIKESVNEKEIDSEQVIYIPTGDGMCISLINVNTPFDIHIQLALSILEKLHSYNNQENDKMRKFNIRIGINENTDNLITDINGNKNISGAGINYASRIESLCDDNQILVGHSVFDKLSQREKYMNSFRPYDSTVKHGVRLKVHQYINEKLSFLNNEIPSEFKIVQKEIIEVKMSVFEAHYLACCIKHEEFINKNLTDTNMYCMRVLLGQLAEDIVENSTLNRTKLTPMFVKVKRTIEEHIKYLKTVDFYIIVDLSEYYKNKLLNISKYVDDEYLFVNDLGKKKLLENYPKISDEVAPRFIFKA